MPIGKQTLKYFFGATNTDASKKGVRIGDLIEASNVRQVNAGEYIQRGGLVADKVQVFENYGGGLVPIGMASPDGSQIVTRTSDGRAYCSVDGENHRFLGSVPMLLADVAVRSTAGESGENETPLAKRAGQYSVHYVSRGYFEITRSDENGGGIVERHRISMTAGNTSVSSQCKSMALISSDDFDDSALWILWTDWNAASISCNPGAVYSRRVPYDDLTGGSAYVCHEFTGSGVAKGEFITSMSASVVGDGECAVAFCGFEAKNALDDSPITWWETETGNGWQGAQIGGHFYLDKNTGSAKTSPAPFDRRVGDNRPLVGAGCCILTAKGVHEHHPGHWYYAYLGAALSIENAQIVFVNVDASDLTYSLSAYATEVFPVNSEYPLEPPLNGADFVWHWLASISGHETSSGVEMVVSVRPYWYYIPEGETVPVPATPSPDTIKTSLIRRTDLGVWSTIWTARAAWLACGYFRNPGDTEDLIVTGYSDKDGILPTYHIRRMTDGAIVAQIAYGQAANCGAVGVASSQTTQYLSDIQQPMLHGGPAKHIVLGLQSENTQRSVDIAEVQLSEPATWQAPAVIEHDVYSPGPMVTACGGWQTLREAVPLLSPERPQSFYWTWDLDRHAVPITDGTVTVAIVYRFVTTNGNEAKIARSAPYILNNALRLVETPDQNDFLKVPTLRHLTGAVNSQQFNSPSGPTPKAQIELYIDIGDGAPQLWDVYDNDPTVDYLEIYPQNVNGKQYSRLIDAIEAHEASETLYTMGDALEYSPPPMARAVCVWRNRLFAAFGSRIYPTQEFVAGFSPAWNESLSTTWADGTGGIVAICQIDFNYLAIFKQDAIGIISGPGPDGLGRGGYIVQTIPTNKGVANPRSVVNGADGCYFQDATTGRLCLLTPQLQVVECAPGAWHLSSQQITSALVVEPERQVWFATDGANIIVLDYKHKTESCPFGSVYTWNATEIGYPRCMCIVGGAPKLMRQSGQLANYAIGTGYDTGLSDGSVKAAIAMAIETGEMQVDNLQGEFALSRLAVLGEYVAPHQLTITTYPSYAASGTSASTTVTAGPEQFVVRPPNCMRIQSVRARLVALSSVTANGSTIYGQSLKFVGFALEVQPRGRISWQSTSRTF